MTMATLPARDEAVEPVAVIGTHDVVAVVIVWNKRLALLKRSHHVSHDRGRWHCVTGYIDAGATPLAQALTEVWEETGLQANDLAELRQGPTLRLADDSAGPGTIWNVHTFVATSRQRKLRLNDENVTYRWVPSSKVARFDGQVHWLADVLIANDLIIGRTDTLKRTLDPAAALSSARPVCSIR